MSVGLSWPPKKEDLERLYLDEKLSAAKIAQKYGLKCKNPKAAESTVLYQLKRNGIARRDAADHVRKVTAEMVDAWAKRYSAGESLKRIGGDQFNPVTVWNHLKSRGVPVRDKVEAQIKAVSKYERKPFAGDAIERAYLIGLRYGDLHVVQHGRAIRVRVSTTHPAMADLFDSLFSPYGHVHRYPREAKLTGYEWTLECDLDRSFEFLLLKPSIANLEKLSEAEWLAFLAGLFDAEGSVLLHNKKGRFNPELAIVNTEDGLLHFLQRSIQRMGFHCSVDWAVQDTERQGITGYSKKGRITIWRFKEVQRFLGMLPIQHQEKVAKSVLIQAMTYGESKTLNLQTVAKWEELSRQIKKQRDAFVNLAREAIASRKAGLQSDGARRPDRGGIRSE